MPVAITVCARCARCRAPGAVYAGDERGPVCGCCLTDELLAGELLAAEPGPVPA